MAPEVQNIQAEPKRLSENKIMCSSTLAQRNLKYEEITGKQ